MLPIGCLLYLFRWNQHWFLWIGPSDSEVLQTGIRPRGCQWPWGVNLLCSLLRQLVDDEQAVAHLRQWNDGDTTPAIGVITGYRKQVGTSFRERLESESWAIADPLNDEIDTIDSYQRSESRIILVNLVRHDTGTRGGFMTDNASETAISDRIY
ncbi:AAA domain-containing protein [Vibrio metschnikovii]